MANVKLLKTDNFLGYLIELEVSSKDINLANAFNKNSTVLVDESNVVVFKVATGKVSDAFVSKHGVIVPTSTTDKAKFLFEADGNEELAKAEGAAIQDKLRYVEAQIVEAVTRVRTAELEVI